MTLSDLSIRRPVFAWMIMIGLIVFGVICFLGMGISQMPDVDFPVINVSVTWTGASPETMETAVADVIENAVMSVEGIREVNSVCQEGLSRTTIEFDLSRNIDVALQEVQTKIAQAQKGLPDDIDPPVVTKSNPEDQPIMWATLTGPDTLRDKILFVQDHLKDQITTINGVGDVRLGGYVDPNMRIWLNTQSMNTLDITVDDVISALEAGSHLTPSGYMDNGNFEANVDVVSEAKTPKEFGNIAILQRSGSPRWKAIRIKEVGRVEEGLADIRRISRIDGESTVGLGIIKQRGSNAVAVATAVKEKIKRLAKLLPKGMSLRPVVDSTKFIKDATHELLFTLMMSVILTAIVCWLFLGSISSAINVVLAIPTALIGAFIVLYFMGFTINTFTLLALSLSIGIVVDDSIMVLENIVRYVEMGMTRVRAALLGAREITGAALASSLAILAIFVPVVFMKGIIGKFFFQFGVTISVAVAFSFIEALTLAPMRCSQFLSQGNESRISLFVNHWLNKLADVYKRVLKFSLNHRWKIVGVSTAVFLASFLLLKGVRKEFVPAQDQSRFLVAIYTPLGSSLQFTDNVFKQAEAYLKTRPEVNDYFVAIGGFTGGLVNQGNMFVMLKDPDDRPITKPFHHHPSQAEVMALVRKHFSKIPGVARVSLLDLSQAFTAHRGYPITFVVQGPEWDKIATYAKELMKKMAASGMMTDIDTDYNPNMPELQIVPDREKAALRGVPIKNIADTISALVGSLNVGKYTDASGHRDDVRIKLLDKFNRKPSDITKIWVRNNHGEAVPLSDLVKINHKTALLTISRHNRERAVTVYANLMPKASQDVATEFIQNAAKKILPQGYHVVLSGNSQTFKESFESLLMALFLGIFVAYMVLGAQFNSFIHPFTVLLALPFSATGAFIALWLTGMSLNIYSLIGLLLLMGIVKKNSILLVDFTNQRRDEGAGVQQALLEACPLRLRPILMTSIATVVAAIPEALALGPGAETVRPMAVVVIGGVLFSTVLTLLVVPCAYSLLVPLESKRLRRELQEALAAPVNSNDRLPSLNGPSISGPSAEVPLGG